MALVVHDYAFGADVDLVILTEVLGLLVRVFEAVLVCGRKLNFF